MKNLPAGRYLIAGIFIFASITDYLDGSIARRLKAQSNFGRMLDPIADKMLVTSILLILLAEGTAPVLPIIIIICREIFISGMREYLATQKIVIAVDVFGKIKTAAQMMAIICLLLEDKITMMPHQYIIGCVTIWIAALLTLYSAAIYVWKYRKYFVVFR